MLDTDPIRLEITYIPGDEVLKLRSRVAELEAELLKLTGEYKQLEWKYCCNINLKLQLGDWARAEGIKIPKRFLDSM